MKSILDIILKYHGKDDRLVTFAEAGAFATQGQRVDVSKAV
jgi:hypothetical protein